jgi:methylamine utilization protein MauE
MALAGPAFVVLNSAAATILLQAGLYKLAVPAPLRRALAELAPGHFGAIGDGAVRILAAVEILVGVALLAPATHVPGAIAAAALGVLFAASGVAGRVRGAAAPCGCLGATGSRSLGPVNIAVGLGLIVFGVFAAGGTATGGYGRPGPVLTALFLLLLCMSINRGPVLRLLRRRPAEARIGEG